jgi:hypothetical protein
MKMSIIENLYGIIWSLSLFLQTKSKFMPVQNKYLTALAKIGRWPFLPFITTEPNSNYKNHEKNY